MQKSFSLIELIFVIVVIGIIATIAIPKLTNITAKANTSTIKNDIHTIISSIQNYYLLHNKIDKISDSVNLNSSNWHISDKIVIFKENNKECIKIEINNSNLILNVNNTTGKICENLSNLGIKTTTYQLN